MKKLTVFIFSLALAQSICFAQFSITGSAGLNVSKISSVIKSNAPSTSIENINSSFTPFYFAEIRPTYRFGAHWSASLGAQYSVKGYNVKANNSLVALSYIDLLPTAEYRFNKYLSVFAGFNIGYLSSEKELLDGKWISLPQNPFFEKTDFGGLLGVRAYYKNVCFNLHFNRSITPIKSLGFKYVTFTNGGGFVETGTENVYNQNFQLGVGYIFNFESDKKM